jgi:hypothetical protein
MQGMAFYKSVAAQNTFTASSGKSLDALVQFRCTSPLQGVKIARVRKLILPAISTLKAGRSEISKFSTFALSENVIYVMHPASSKRGVRVVTTREAGRRWTRTVAPDECCRCGLEIVWSWHPGADAKFAMFMTSIAGDGDKRAGPRGDHV